jgi:cell division protein ZapA
MAEIIIIQAVIGDRNYRLKINRDEEEMVRKTLKIVNEKILEYKTHFAGKDMQDYISMALLWFATEQNNAGSLMIQQQEMQQKISQLESHLDRLLKE